MNADQGNDQANVGGAKRGFWAGWGDGRRRAVFRVAQGKSRLELQGQLELGEGFWVDVGHEGGEFAVFPLKEMAVGGLS